MPVPWTKERIERLKSADVRQIRSNADARGERELVALCDEVLRGRPGAENRQRRARKRESPYLRLVSRKKAFELRRARLRNPRWSWGGIKASDGTVVFTVWATDIEATDDGICRYMLWGPNRGGSRPWSETAGGMERLEHCRLAASQPEAEGVLIYGERRGEDLPLDEASKVSGADPTTVLRFKVQQEAMSTGQSGKARLRIQPKSRHSSRARVRDRHDVARD